MKSDALDRRVKYTKMMLKQSLLELIADKPINKVAIKDICALADVNRGTFYNHYNDQYHLLGEIQSDLETEIRAALEKKITDASSSADIIGEILRCIAAQSSLCKTVFGDYGDGAFLKRLMFIAREQFIDEWKTKLKHGDVRQLDKFYTYTANGICGIVQEWLQSGMNESPEAIALFIERTTNHGLSFFVNEIK